MDGASTALLVGLGNPLLDIIAVVTKDYVTSKGLPLDSAFIVDGPDGLFSEILLENPKVSYSLGGVAQNAIRVAQWMLGPDRPQTCFIGSVGTDSETRERMLGILEREGVRGFYDVIPGSLTGKCVSLVNDNRRSMVAFVGAAQMFRPEFLSSPGVEKILQDAQILYTTGFFALSSYESVIKAYKFADESKKMFCFNLAGDFLMRDKATIPMMHETIYHTSVLFGNDDEYTALSESYSWETRDLGEIAHRVANLPKSGGGNRIVFLTRGENGCIVAVGGQDGSRHFQAPVVDTVVDTTGAGDSFAGGVLAWLVRHSGEAADVDDMVKAGNFAAKYVISREGINFDDESGYFLN